MIRLVINMDRITIYHRRRRRTIAISLIHIHVMDMRKQTMHQRHRIIRHRIWQTIQTRPIDRRMRLVKHIDSSFKRFAFSLP
jgi:hypothetical protein